MSSPAPLPTLVEDVLRIILALLLPPFDMDHVTLASHDQHNAGCHRYVFNPQSQVLQVSKQWYRLGLPLLYRHLRVDHAGHAVAILRAFYDKPMLGPAVRALSLGGLGGMGTELKYLVSDCPNIDTLFLSTRQLRSNVTATGLLRMLPTLRLKTLCYNRCTPTRAGNKVTTAVNNKVRECMLGAWSSTLKSVAIYETEPVFGVAIMADVLRQLPVLEELRITGPHLCSWVNSLGSRDSFNMLASAPRLSVIRCLGRRDQPAIIAGLSELQAPGSLRDKIDFVSTIADYDWLRDHEDFRNVAEKYGLVYALGSEPVLPIGQ